MPNILLKLHSVGQEIRLAEGELDSRQRLLLIFMNGWQYVLMQVQHYFVLIRWDLKEEDATALKLPTGINYLYFVV